MYKQTPNYSYDAIQVYVWKEIIWVETLSKHFSDLMFHLHNSGGLMEEAKAKRSWLLSLFWLNSTNTAYNLNPNHFLYFHLFQGQ